MCINSANHLWNSPAIERFAALPPGPVCFGTRPQGEFILQTARLFILTLLIVVGVIPVMAECDPAKETPLEAHIGLNSEIDSPPIDTGNAVMRVSLPDAPTPQKSKTAVRVRVIDKKFIFVMAALGGAESLRFTTHQLVVRHEFDAGAPWITSVPPNQHLVLKFGAIYASEMLVAYELKKPHSWLPGDKVIKKLWWVYPGVMTPMHIKNGIRSMRTQPPAGTTADECPPEYQQYCGGQ